jgi:tetratricopeptide (TPR) repeat protein
VQRSVTRALCDCSTILKAEPSNVLATMRAAMCHQWLGNLVHAQTFLTRVSALPGLSLQQRQECDKRSANVARLIVLTDSVWDRVAFTAASPVEAAALARKAAHAAQHDNSCGHLWLAAAAAARRAGHHQDALSYAEKAHKHGADDLRAQAYWLQVDILFAQGKMLDCVDCIKRQAGTLAAWQHLRKAAGSANKPVEPVRLRIPAPDAVQELLVALQRAVDAKERGNAATRAHRNEEAVAANSEALAEARAASPAFHAVLHSNRAAARLVRNCSTCMWLPWLGRCTLRHAPGEPEFFPRCMKHDC